MVNVVKGVLVDVCDGMDVAEPIGETDGVVDTVFDKDADDVGELLGEDELLCIDVVVAEILDVEVEVADIVDVAVSDNVAWADNVSLEVDSLDIVG